MFINANSGYLTYHSAELSSEDKLVTKRFWNQILKERSALIIQRNNKLFDYLLKMTDKNGAVCSTATEIGAAINLSANQVNISLKKMRDAGLIERNRGVIFLKILYNCEFQD